MSPDHTRQTVSLHVFDRTAHLDDHLAEIARQLSGAEMTPIEEESGFFDITLEAADHAAAVQRVIDALAAAGADDHIAIAG